MRFVVKMRSVNNNCIWCSPWGHIKISVFWKSKCSCLISTNETFEILVFFTLKSNSAFALTSCKKRKLKCVSWKFSFWVFKVPAFSVVNQDKFIFRHCFDSLKKINWRSSSLVQHRDNKAFIPRRHVWWWTCWKASYWDVIL